VRATICETAVHVKEKTGRAITRSGFLAPILVVDL
jgi:hypothetical protein